MSKITKEFIDEKVTEVHSKIIIGPSSADVVEYLEKKFNVTTQQEFVEGQCVKYHIYKIHEMFYNDLNI